MKFPGIRLDVSLWILLVGFCGGMLFAFPFAAPVLGAVLPESVATLWGAALGAAMAVAGATWAANASDRRRRQDAVALILAMLEPIAFFLDELAGAYGAPSTPHPGDNDQEPDVLQPDDWQEVRDSANHLLRRIDLLSKRNHRIDAVLALLGSDALDAYFSFETELEAVIEVARKVEEEASAPGLTLYPQHPRWSVRFALCVKARLQGTQIHPQGLLVPGGSAVEKGMIPLNKGGGTDGETR